MTVFRIVTPGLNQRTGAQIFMNFECDKPSVQALADALGRGDLVVGASLQTRPGGTNTWEVVGRRTVALTKAGVAMIDLSHWRFVERGTPMVEAAE